MDRSDEFRTIVERIMREVEGMTPSERQIRTEVVIDHANGHYQLGQVGWDNGRRVDDIFLHVDVCDGKVWIQHDGTDLTMADMLLEAGIPRESIVLAFHRPELRKFTEFSVA